MSKLMGVFSSVTREFFQTGKGPQYDFRRKWSIAYLAWSKNLTIGIRDYYNNKRALEAERKAKNENANDTATLAP